MADHTLDAKGLNCPLPMLKARKALKEVAAGGKLFDFIDDSLGFSIGKTVNAGHGFEGVDSLRP